MNQLPHNIIYDRTNGKLVVHGMPDFVSSAQTRASFPKRHPLVSANRILRVCGHQGQRWSQRGLDGVQEWYNRERIGVIMAVLAGRWTAEVMPSEQLHAVLSGQLLIAREAEQAFLRNYIATITDAFGEPTSLEEDLLRLASAIYACDLNFKRGEREDITRQFGLTVPVVNLAAFEGIKKELQYALYRLSHDAWEITFTARVGDPERTGSRTDGSDGTVLLFSGGLDSLAAAIKYGSAKGAVHLVSHINHNQTVSGAQEKLLEYLKQKFKDKFVRTAFRVGGHDRTNIGFPFAPNDDREDSQRTRSFLFLALAGLVARRRGIHRVVMIAENGPMAIHLPLTAARIGAFSTHTAHPNFVAVMSTLLSKLFSFEITIENPFLYLTKGEVVRETVLHHKETLVHAISCWKASRVKDGFNHCGFCVPCLIRRTAIEIHGVSLPEYRRDLLAEDVGKLEPSDDGKRNLADLSEFVYLFNSASPAQLEQEYPDLADSSFDGEEAIKMYQRFAKEVVEVLKRYPGPAKLLS